MVSRTECILGSLAVFSKEFPEVELPESLPKFPLAPRTAVRLVMDLPPEELQKLLALAHDCHLYTLFAPPAKVAPNDTRYVNAPHRLTISLAAAIQGIQRWLRTEEAKKVLELVPVREALACLPAEVGQLSGLERLSLVEQAVATLPAELEQLSNLTSMTLYHNTFKKLPSCIGQLVRLQKLDLGNKQLNEIPSCIGQLSKLEWLQLYNNPLKSVSAETTRLPCLAFLYLDEKQCADFQSQLKELQERGVLYLLG